MLVVGFALYLLQVCFTWSVSFSLQKAFRTGTSTRLDDRVFAMCQMKSQPLVHLMKTIHPNLYRIDRLTDEVCFRRDALPKAVRYFQWFSHSLLPRGGKHSDRGTQ